MALPRKTLSMAAAIAALVGALVAAYFVVQRHAADHGDHVAVGSLAQTLLRVERPVTLEVPPLAATDGQPFTAARLQGRWSVLFFGFTHCPDVCPTTLQVLAAFTRHAPAEAAAKPQIFFVSTDPMRDDVARMRGYLENFAAPILGVTGSRENIDRFTAGVGAGARREGGVMDHSTSLFVVDPAGRLVAVLLHPGDPAAIAADLAQLRRDPPAKHASLAP